MTVAGNPESRFDTARLVLRRPTAADADGIFRGYASDADVTRYLGWPRHTDPSQTAAFVRFSDAQWDRWHGGPLLVESRADGTLLGATGQAALKYVSELR